MPDAASNSGFESAAFLKSAYRPDQLVADRGIEIAFAGRSNAGKSSALNAIVGRRALARTSKTPGRTQMINFFGLAEDRRLVDLPGYGFARVPDSLRQHWRKLMEHYFADRKSLRALVLVVDIRRGLTDFDWQMLDLAEASGCETLVLLTKADKLKRGPALEQRRKIRQALGEGTPLALFSATKGMGVTEARQRLRRWLEG